MRQVLMGRAKVGIAITVLALVALLSPYQNCAPPFDTTLESSLSENDYPFAFDTVVDTVSYMSCSGAESTAAESAYYTFRVGAYTSGGGIRFSDDFLNATQDLSPMQRVESLAGNAQNRGSVLQLSVRKESSYVTVFSEGSSASQGTDYSNILEPLDSSVIAQQIAGLSPSQRVNYFAGLPGLSERTVEGSVRFLRGEGLAQGLRNSMTHDRFLLTLLYGDTEAANDLAPKGPDMTRKVHGSGFRTTFGYGHGLAQESELGNPPNYEIGSLMRTVHAISEINLLDGRNTNRAWVCPPEFRFMVVRPEDLGVQQGLGQAYCDTSVVNPNSLPGNLRVAYDVARSVLRPEDWHVDVVRRCVVPKKTTSACYEQDQGKVNYYGTLGGANCGLGTGGYTKVSLPNGAQTQTYDVMCPHYVSVCIRQ